MPEYGPQGRRDAAAVEGWTGAGRDDHRSKGLEAPVVVLCELDGRVGEAELASLLYVGATRARVHLVVVCSESLSAQIGGSRRRI
jgi:ATP-dependent exoDNAse (exonuclease V) beta subunit